MIKLCHKNKLICRHLYFIFESDEYVEREMGRVPKGKVVPVDTVKTSGGLEI